MTSNERSTINTSHVGLDFAASAPFARKRAVSERSSRSATPRDTSLFLFPTLAMYLIDGISPSDTITVANRCAIISIILACACDCSDPTANVPRNASSTPTLKPFGSTVKYSRFISLQFPSMDTHASLALIAFKTPRGAAEVKNTCALRYSFFSQSSTTRATERSLGAMKYTPSNVGCGARATSKFSTTASVPRRRIVHRSVTRASLTFFHPAFAFGSPSRVVVASPPRTAHARLREIAHLARRRHHPQRRIIDDQHPPRARAIAQFRRQHVHLTRAKHPNVAVSRASRVHRRLRARGNARSTTHQ